MLLGLISDTHGRFDPQLPRLFLRCDAIVHAGDIGGLEVLRALEAIAPVHAVLGNTDSGLPWLMEREVATFGEVRTLLVHRPEDWGDTTGFELVVSGHTHLPRIEQRGETLFVNPGSAGPRRFSDVPRSAGFCRIEPDAFHVELIDLDAGTTFAAERIRRGS